MLNVGNWKTVLKTIKYEWLLKMDGRPILLADLGNEKILFYKRTGDGGEPKEGQPDMGNFAPFFGFSFLTTYEYWFIKGYPERYDKYKKEAQELDQIAKEIPTDLPEINIFEANKFFRNKGATLGRPEYDKMGYSVFYEYPIVMTILGRKDNDAGVVHDVKSVLDSLRNEYSFFKRTDKYPKLLDAYEKIEERVEKLEKIEEQQRKQRKYIHHVYNPKKKQVLLKYVENINKMIEFLEKEYKKFLEAWDDWKDDEDMQIDFSPIKYKEMKLNEAYNRRDILST